MSYAAFNTAESAQEYADACQQHLVNTIGATYISTRWSTVAQGSDGRYYVNLLQSFPPQTEDIIPDVPVTGGAE